MNIRLIIVLLLLNTSVFAQLHTYKWTNGNKKAEGVVKDGLEQEKWTFWSKEGVIQQEVTYKDGEFHGEYINYNKEGKKVEQGNFVRSMKEGECKVWYDNGQLELVGYNKIGYRDRYGLSIIHREIKKKKDILKGMKELANGLLGTTISK